MIALQRCAVNRNTAYNSIQCGLKSFIMQRRWTYSSNNSSLWHSRQLEQPFKDCIDALCEGFGKIDISGNPPSPGSNASKKTPTLRTALSTVRKLQKVVHMHGLRTIFNGSKSVTMRMKRITDQLVIVPSIPQNNQKLPKALLLSTATNLKGYFYSQMFVTLVQKYNLQIEHVQSTKQFWETLDKEITRETPQLLVIIGHGNFFGNELDIGHKGDKITFYSTSEEPKKIFKKLHPNTEIILVNCSGGKRGETGSNIANWFARCAPHARITAPESMITVDTPIVQSLNPLTIEYFRPDFIALTNPLYFLSIYAKLHAVGLSLDDNPSLPLVNAQITSCFPYKKVNSYVIEPGSQETIKKPFFETDLPISKIAKATIGIGILCFLTNYK